jgi:hypothetical protein
MSSRGSLTGCVMGSDISSYSRFVQRNVSHTPIYLVNVIAESALFASAPPPHQKKKTEVGDIKCAETSVATVTCH